MLGLLPSANEAARVGVLDGAATDQVGGWHVFVGDGPHFEFWEGTDADYEETEQIVRAVVEGRWRCWWTSKSEREFLRPWRKHRVRQQHNEIVLLHRLAKSTYAGGGVFPRAGDGVEVQGAPY